MAKAAANEALRKLAHDLRSVMNNVNLNLVAAQRLAARSTDERAEALREHLNAVASELNRLKQTVDKAAKELA